jgi:site-specific DNA-methyltransferase (adenine-specific)
MRYLCRLVTPPDGVVLDPFCGSGSTLVGALQEGFRYIGIEKDPDYVNIAYARTKHALKEWGRESRQQVLREVVS